MPEPIVHEVCVELTDRIRRVTQNNPGMFPGPGTNTHLIGAGSLLILDPGEDSDEHFEAVCSAVGDATVVGVLPTHRHHDHWPLAPRLARQFEAPVLAFGAHGPFAVDRPLADGDSVFLEDDELEIVHTPGHASDHLSLHYPGQRALFTGDHVMGWSTSIISPPDGSLNEYMASLDRLRELVLRERVQALYPAHGEALSEPLARIEELKKHRQQRTEQALAALAERPGTIPELVESIYTDVDPGLHPAAARSLLAHLLALVEDGRVSSSGGDPALATYRLA